MSYLRNILKVLLFTIPLHGALAEPLEVVFQNGRSIPVSSLAMEGDKLIVAIETQGYNVGQTFSLAQADHIYGVKPAEINQAIALALTGKSMNAQTLLLPIVNQHAITAKIPGNFWLDAARALLVAYALHGNEANVTAIGKKISDATPAQGSEPFVLLGKALLMPVRASNAKEREIALRDLCTDSQSAKLSAYASFCLGNLFKSEKKPVEALEAFLSVPCLYPSGDLIINAAAELEASDLLASLNRREEALALAESALRVSTGTVLADEASRSITSLKK